MHYVRLQRMFSPAPATPPPAAAALDSWERLREAAAAVLLRLPTPLPGTGSPGELQPLLGRALCLLGCPRSREADAGAQLVVLLLRKYGGGSGARGGSGVGGSCCWLLDVAAGTVAAPLPGRTAEELQGEALWAFLVSGCDLLESRVQAAGQDWLEACRGNLALGVLLALRCVLRARPGSARCQAGRRTWWPLVLHHVGHIPLARACVSPTVLPAGTLCHTSLGSIWRSRGARQSRATTGVRWWRACWLLCMPWPNSHCPC